MSGGTMTLDTDPTGHWTFHSRMCPSSLNLLSRFSIKGRLTRDLPMARGEELKSTALKLITRCCLGRAPRGCLCPLSPVPGETFPRTVTGKLQPSGVTSEPGGWDLAGLCPWNTRVCLPGRPSPSGLSLPISRTGTMVPPSVNCRGQVPILVAPRSK